MTAGFELQTACSHALQRIDATIRRFSRDQKSEILILCIASFANHWLLSRLPQFTEQNPDLCVKFHSAFYCGNDNSVEQAGRSTSQQHL